MDSNLERHPGRLEGESIFYYYLRRAGREYRDRITVLIQDHGLSWEQAYEAYIAEWDSYLPSDGESWQSFALRTAQRTVAKVNQKEKVRVRKLQINHVMALVNLAYGLQLTMDEIYAVIRPERSAMQSVYDKRYRETHREECKQRNAEYYQRNKERLKARALQRYHRLRAEDTRSRQCNAIH